MFLISFSLEQLCNKYCISNTVFFFFFFFLGGGGGGIFFFFFLFLLLLFFCFVFCLFVFFKIMQCAFYAMCIRPYVHLTLVIVEYSSHASQLCLKTGKTYNRKIKVKLEKN